MRRLTMPILAIMLLLAGCSSSEPMAFDLSHPMAPPEQPFTVSGAAVDEGVVCPIGMWVDERMEEIDGNQLGPEGWPQIFDKAVETNSVAEAMSHKEFRCGDGTGSIVITDHVYLDFAVIDVESLGNGQTKFGTWTVEGTGDYDSLSGSGDTVAAFDEGAMRYIGEVEG